MSYGTGSAGAATSNVMKTPGLMPQQPMLGKIADQLARCDDMLSELLGKLSGNHERLLGLSPQVGSIFGTDGVRNQQAGALPNLDMRAEIILGKLIAAHEVIDSLANAL